MIEIFARPKALWLPPALWTRIRIEGDDEETVANLVTAHLSSTRHEVVLEDPEDGVDADPLAPWGDENDED